MGDVKIFTLATNKFNYLADEEIEGYNFLA